MKKKVLESEFHRERWNDLWVVTLPIDELWQSVPKAVTHKGKSFYPEIIKDIQKNGLRFPILVVDAPKSALIEQKQRFKTKMNELPFWQSGDLDAHFKTVWGGSNRYSAAKELGYTHIDCVVLDNYESARSMQRLHRAPYIGTFY